jgi:polar amino acid transport system substrate-binding protein
MTPALRSELAPTGKLRVGINYGNFLLVLQDAASGEPQGIAPDLARELARRAGVPVEFVRFEQAGKMADAVTRGVWDIAFLAAEPARADEIAFTAAYLEIEATYLVPAGSPISAIDEVDRPGVRIAVAGQAAYDLYLSRTLKHAQLVRAEGLDGSYKLFVAQKLEVLSGLKPRLLMDLEKLPGARILDGRFTAVQQGIGTPKARAAAAAFLREFVEEAKSTGLVAQAMARHGVRGVNVAPAVPAR